MKRSFMKKLIKEKRHNVFPTKGNWPEPTVCTECHSVFIKGRWTWTTPPDKANTVLCPACRRIAANFPAGYIEIKGSFLREHEVEIRNLINNIEKDQKAAHPLERIMTIQDEDDRLLVTTTGIHIARRIGEALARAYQGNMSFQYSDGEKTVRVFWSR